MTSSGSVRFEAHGPSGQSVEAEWGPQPHAGSTWKRPGAEWGTGWVFPEAGCWTIHAARSGQGRGGHDRATHLGLAPLLAEIGYSTRGLASTCPAHRVAQLLGGHHGRYYEASDRRQRRFPMQMKPTLGDAAWAEQRRGLVETVQAVVGVPASIASAADTVLVLKRVRGQADATLHLTGRDVDETERALSFDTATGTWALLDGPAADHTMRDTRTAILRYVRDRPGLKTHVFSGDSAPVRIATSSEAAEQAFGIRSRAP